MDPMKLHITDRTDNLLREAEVRRTANDGHTSDAQELRLPRRRQVVAGIALALLLLSAVGTISIGADDPATGPSGGGGSSGAAHYHR